MLFSASACVCVSSLLPPYTFIPSCHSTCCFLSINTITKPLQLIPNPDKSSWFHFVSLYCTDGDLAEGSQIRLFCFSYQVFTYETCSCCECAGCGCRAELSSPVLQQGKVGEKVIIEVMEETGNQNSCGPKLLQCHVAKLY